MANNNSKDSAVEFRSLSGQVETAEPTASAANASAVKKATSKTPPAGGNTPSLRKSSSTTLAPKVPSPATGQSPHTSRTTSPVRKDKATSLTPGLSTQPSAAAIQRALSASAIPQLTPQQSQSQSQSQNITVTEAVSKLAKGQKSATTSGETTPQWPISPRMKSPPPSGPNSRRSSTKKPEAPAIQVVGASPSNAPPTTPKQLSTEGQKTESQLQTPSLSKIQSRGPSGKSVLETVQENSSDTLEPSPAAVQAAADLKPLTKISDGDDQALSRKGSKAELERQVGESGSESPGNKSDGTTRGRRNSGANNASTTPTPRTKSVAKPSYGLSSTKSRPGDGKQGMTVETETVQSIPQSAIAAAGDRSAGLRADNGGSVKHKPSSETIRPRKERKKAERKTRSVNQGTAATKADLFEARVANAVDEANESDSDETFVYESNPMETQRRQRHHSRTPSVTSSHSMAGEQRGAIRSYGDAFDERRVGGKRSMKFSSNPYNDHDSPESNNGTVRSHTPRHIGRYGRSGHQSGNHDPDSPFTQASKLRNQHLANGRSRPNSPKSPQSMHFRTGAFFTSNRKQEHPYDFDTEANADDERTPLMGTVRTPRGVRNIHRQSNSANHSMMDDYEIESRGNRLWCFSGRVGACVLTTIMLILVVVAAVFFVFASNRPLQDVRIHRIQNVLASEQELMLDLFVGAVNPNTLAISIGEMDVNVFAKSKHVGAGHTDPNTKGRRKAKDDSDRNPNPIQDPDGHWRNPNDPHHDDSDFENDAQTMLLGRIFHFDQPLLFPASPLTSSEHKSSGQLRLTRPGNKTEAGGSARWEEVIQYPFELIVRGVLKYQLPISARLQSAAVGAKVMVHPEEGLDGRGSMRVEPVDERDKWEWIEWPEEGEDEE